MKHLDLFSGIGGFALAAERVWGDVEHTFVEIDPFCQEVLKKHWPNSKIYGDIRRFTTNAELGLVRSEEEIQTGRTPSVPGGTKEQFDLLTGGFPCQPFSQAGRRKGTGDDRYLWPEMLRVIREFKPTWIIGENVGGLVTWSDGLVLEQVHLDLEAEGYEVQAFIIPAVSVNAPHRRDRVWIVARNTDRNRRSGRDTEIHSTEGGQPTLDNSARRYSPSRPVIAHTEYEREGDTIGRGNDERAPARTAGSDTDVTHAIGERKGQRGYFKTEGQRGEHRGVRGYQRPDWSADWIEVAAELCRVDDGIPRRLDRTPRLKALGNAIVPQVAEEVMRSIPLHHGLQDK